ncbi:tail assembly chaperone [Lactobacillus acetotolerans]|uniref:tail assembly chaperone n=1 Tax=Lactobacillus acetotolerans TaxID=1600 RepID=UPI002FDA7500
MESFKINGKDVELNFGVRFVRELDKVAGVDVEGVPFGFGLTKSIPALQSYDPATLSDVIYSAAFKSAKRPSLDEVDDFIDSIGNVTDLKKLFSDVSSELKKANALKAALTVKNVKA